MYNDDNRTIQNILGKQRFKIGDTITALASQGYSVNNRKLCKLFMANVLAQMFRQLPLFDNTQSFNARMFYNKFGEK